MSIVLEINESNFEQEVLKAGTLVLVDFWAPWCGPCKMVKPVLDKVAESYSDKIKFTSLNTDDNQKTAMDYHITGIPSLLLFKDGKTVDRVIGYVPEEDLVKFLKKHI
ncbi:MAG: thioredoxin [Firmicutes bacterium]|nr:thioredoxin [Bacillota bacterium]